MRLYVQTGVRWIWGGGLLMVFGALLSGWRGGSILSCPDGAALIRPTSESMVGRIRRSRRHPGKMMLLCGLIFLPLPPTPKVVDTGALTIHNSRKALSIAGQLRCPQCQNQNSLNPRARGGQYAPSGLQHGGREGKSEAEITAR